jgi:ABC-type lipoprotein export system ATPase subunit
LSTVAHGAAEFGRSGKNMKRIIIIGNSGSGKSFLSEKLNISDGLFETA